MSFVFSLEKISIIENSEYGCFSLTLKPSILWMQSGANKSKKSKIENLKDQIKRERKKCVTKKKIEIV